MKGVAEYEPPADAQASSLKTTSGTDLMRLELEDPKEVVPGLFVEGLSILAGKPKLGKSWLMLNAALAISQGGMVLGKIQVEKGVALYLGLEDSQRRLQRRLEMMTDDAPKTLQLATALPRMDEGGLEQLSTWLVRNPDTRMVVIDTLVRVRPRVRRSSDVYEEDASVGSALQALAVEHGIALVVVHHLRKASADDPVDSVSGSTGLTGAADSVLVLDRKRQEAEATLYITGRDIEEDKLLLSFDAKNGFWSAVGEVRDATQSIERRKIMELLSGLELFVTPKAISEATGLPHGSVRHLVRDMSRKGFLLSDGKGGYARAK